MRLIQRVVFYQKMLRDRKTSWQERSNSSQFLELPSGLFRQKTVLNKESGMGRSGPLRSGRRGVVVVIGCMHKIVTSHEVGYTGRKNVCGYQGQDMSRHKSVFAKEIERDLHPCCHDHPPTGRRPRARALGGLLTSEGLFHLFHAAPATSWSQFLS